MLPGAGGMGEGYIGWEGERDYFFILFLQFSETKYMGYEIHGIWDGMGTSSTRNLYFDCY